LKDECKRRDYDCRYHFIRRGSTFPQPTQQTPCQPSTSSSQSRAHSEGAQIAALEKSKQERSARWRTKKDAFVSSIDKLQEDIRRLQQQIKNLDSIAAAEAAAEAQRNSWGAWLLSPIYKRAEISEEERSQKDRERQERRIQKDMKDRWLIEKNADLRTQNNLLEKAKKEVEAADLADDEMIRVLQGIIRTREIRERQEKDRVERERVAKIRKQQQEQRERETREAAEALRKQQAEAQKLQEERIRRWSEQFAQTRSHGASTRQTHTSTCRHDGWWPKVQGRTACPECHDVWTYLLQCPGCDMKACPRCQSRLRPTRTARNATRSGRRDYPKVRTPSPDYYEDYY
jgi:DNA repair exonuclease SbcCD ATPase subunit